MPTNSLDGALLLLNHSASNLFVSTQKNAEVM